MKVETDSPNAVQRAVRGLIATRPVAWVLARAMHRLDGAVGRASGGRTTASTIFTGLPIITLTTTGAKSGQPRRATLVGVPNGEQLILIASNWGQSHHPAWYYNVKANPEVKVSFSRQERSAEHPFVARELAGTEREAAWERATSLYPGYQGYAERAGGRIIPVILLERKDKTL